MFNSTVKGAKKMDYTNQMQDRAKARRQEANKPKAVIHIDGNVVPWLKQVKQAVQEHTDWSTGYEATDTATACIQALMQRQFKTDPKSSQRLLTDLVKYRDLMEKSLVWKFKMNEDELRYSESSPDFVKFELGVLDLVIGTAMFAFGRADIVKI